MSERIFTRCPACGNDTLTVDDARHLVCTWLACPDPTLIDRAADIVTQFRQQEWDIAGLTADHAALRAKNARLKTDVEEKQRQVELHCLDWAQDDTAIREAAKRALPGREVEHDGHAVIPIADVAEWMADENERLRAVADAARALSERLQLVHDDPAYQGVWTVGQYQGPSYALALSSLRVELKDLAALDGKEDGK